jgi:hypothetical protein
MTREASVRLAERLACEDCGAFQHGNINCLRCLRWMKRLNGKSDLLRTLIEVTKRRLGAP